MVLLHPPRGCGGLRSRQWAPFEYSAVVSASPDTGSRSGSAVLAAWWSCGWWSSVNVGAPSQAPLRGALYSLTLVAQFKPEGQWVFIGVAVATVAAPRARGTSSEQRRASRCCAHAEVPSVNL